MKFRWQNALILMLVCAFVGAAVALTFSVAGPRIEQRAKESADAARKQLFPEADSFQEQAPPIESGLDNCYGAMQGGSLIGYIAQVTVSGSQGMVEVIAGMDIEGKLVGISVGGSGFSETPGLGSKVKEEGFTSQFTGLSTPIELKQDVDAVTGATVSSRAVVDAVNLMGRYLTGLLK